MRQLPNAIGDMAWWNGTAGLSTVLDAYAKLLGLPPSEIGTSATGHRLARFHQQRWAARGSRGALRAVVVTCPAGKSVRLGNGPDFSAEMGSVPYLSPSSRSAIQRTMQVPPLVFSPVIVHGVSHRAQFLPRARAIS